MIARQFVSDVRDTPEEFEFKKQPRRLPIVPPIPYRWPTNAATAGEYIEDWRERAGRALAMYRLSKATMGCIASHTSRKDGTCPLSNEGLSSRSGRSVISTKRDIVRLKSLGFLIADLHGDDSTRKRRRVLRLAVPNTSEGDQRIPIDNGHGWGSTYPPYVDPTDKGECRDV